MIATAPDTLIYETVTVEEWRRQELRRAGVNPTVAKLLSRAAADLHVMVDAKNRGCPDELLARIFAGAR